MVSFLIGTILGTILFYYGTAVGSKKGRADMHLFYQTFINQLPFDLKVPVKNNFRKWLKSKTK